MYGRVARPTSSLDTIIRSASIRSTVLQVWDMGTHGSPPTRVSAVRDRRARPTRRLADLSLGPPQPDMWAQRHEDSLEYKTRQTSSDKLSIL
jgi:hypothetical protein